jgi:hypothetical protein
MSDVLTVVVQVYNVIRQGYESWITDHGLQGPGQDDIGTLPQSETD